MRCGAVLAAILAACWIHAANSGPIQGERSLIKHQYVSENASGEQDCSSCQWVDIEKLAEGLYDTVTNYFANWLKGLVNNKKKEKLNYEVGKGGIFTTIDCTKETTVVVPEEEIERKTILVDDNDDASKILISTASFTAKVPALYISQNQDYETTSDGFRVPEFTVPSLFSLEDDFSDITEIYSSIERIVEPQPISEEKNIDFSHIVCNKPRIDDSLKSERLHEPNYKDLRDISNKNSSINSQYEHLEEPKTISNTVVVVPEDKIERKTLSIDDNFAKKYNENEIASKKDISTATFTAKVPVLYISKYQDYETTDHSNTFPKFTVPSLFFLDNSNDNAKVNPNTEPIIKSATRREISNIGQDKLHINALVASEPDLETNYKDFRTFASKNSKINPHYEHPKEKESTTRTEISNIGQDKLLINALVALEPDLQTNYKDFKNIANKNSKINPHYEHPKELKRTTRTEISNIDQDRLHINPLFASEPNLETNYKDFRNFANKYSKINPHYEHPKEKESTTRTEISNISQDKLHINALVASQPDLHTNYKDFRNFANKNSKKNPHYDHSKELERTTRTEISNIDQDRLNINPLVASEPHLETNYKDFRNIAKKNSKINPHYENPKETKSTTRREISNIGQDKLHINALVASEPDLETNYKDFRNFANNNSKMNPHYEHPKLKITSNQVIRDSINTTKSPNKHNDYIDNETNKRPTLIIIHDNSYEYSDEADESWEDYEESTLTKSTYNPLANSIINLPSVQPNVNSPILIVKPVKPSEIYKSKESSPVLKTNFDKKLFPQPDGTKGSTFNYQNSPVSKNTPSIGLENSPDLAVKQPEKKTIQTESITSNARQHNPIKSDIYSIKKQLTPLTNLPNEYIKKEKIPSKPTLIILHDNSSEYSDESYESWEDYEESTSRDSTNNPLDDLILNSSSSPNVDYSIPTSAKPAKSSKKYNAEELNPLANAILHDTQNSKPKQITNKPRLNILNDDDDDFSFFIEFNDTGEESDDEITTVSYNEDTRDIKLQQITNVDIAESVKPSSPHPKNSNNILQPTKVSSGPGKPQNISFKTKPIVKETNDGTIITYDEITTIDIDENQANQEIIATKNKKDSLVVPKDGKSLNGGYCKGDIKEKPTEKVKKGIKLSPPHYRKPWVIKKALSHS